MVWWMTSKFGTSNYNRGNATFSNVNITASEFDYTSASPTMFPTQNPTPSPTLSPSENPTKAPSNDPTPRPTSLPTTTTHAGGHVGETTTASPTTTTAVPILQSIAITDDSNIPTHYHYPCRWTCWRNHHC